MLGGRGRGVEGGHQEESRAPQIPECRGREVIRLVGGDRQRPLPGGGEADGVDVLLDQHRLLAEPAGQRELGELSERSLQTRLAPSLLGERTLGGAHELGGGALRSVRGVEQGRLAGGGGAWLPQHDRAID